MSDLPGFDRFFQALWGYEPFPWQGMLAQRVALGRWPTMVDLPTATGKTACIDVALYALAVQSDRAMAERSAPRRIWFVVDRRIVVDEAFERAEEIAAKLRTASGGVLKLVADRLREVAGTDQPLATGRLRGGIVSDGGWARVPSQPAVITSTVDQLGSRLLFRPYGSGQLAAPVYAGLAANDSLILLDEAHCSVPFLQTLGSVQRLRDSAWAEKPLGTPFGFVALSATPSSRVAAGDVFPGDERERALDHPMLRRRLETSKAAELVVLPKPSAGSGDPLVTRAAVQAGAYLADGHSRVAVMVNRVAAAGEIADALTTKFGATADVVLLTGRMRPLEKDAVVKRWKPYLRATRPEEPSRPVLVVATQTLEVGADFSFDALISEAASLDALRQRFGRLARMGADQAASATILAREADICEDAEDPVYGRALSATWALLVSLARGGTVTGGDVRVVDFGVRKLDQLLDEIADISPYLARSADAPMLLPAHLDLLCQTAPVPHPALDISLYLHGRQGGDPDAQVVWRADLSGAAFAGWADVVSVCRPVSGEMLPVPLGRLRKWLATSDTDDPSSDIEGVAMANVDGGGGSRPFLLWRGHDRSRVSRDPAEIGPGDVVVLPAEYGILGVGQSVTEKAVGAGMLDLWEPAFAERGRAAVRVQRAVLAPWAACPPLAELLTLVEAPILDRQAIQDSITAVLDYESADDDMPSPPPEWWCDLLRRSKAGRVEEYPGQGVVLFGPKTMRDLALEPDLFSDEDEQTSFTGAEVKLLAHSQHVRDTAGKLAESCLPAEFRSALRTAGYLHDLGKLDQRFQVQLRRGDEVAAAMQEAPIAKSEFSLLSAARRRAIREACGLPAGFRHEMLSLQLLDRDESLIDPGSSRELVFHLVASHHGHGRPFAPVSSDPAPPAIVGVLDGAAICLSAEERRTLPASWRVDSGVAERFWTMVRRFGWWGEAYLEAVLRLADWYASSREKFEDGR
jgi:CRISPR-associated endonuclease/helicase Cas3